jgi:glycine reductase
LALTLHKNVVGAVALGDRTDLVDGRLAVDTAALGRAVQAQDDRLANVRVGLALPGDATRIVCVKDVIQPRVNETGAETGTGVLRILENVAVVTCGPIVGFQEGIIDMSGPGAAYTPFSQMPLIVLEIDAAAGSDPHAHEAAVREAGMRAAEHVAKSCLDAAPDQTEEVLWDEVTCDPVLPRIAYVHIVLSQGLLHDTYVLGRNAREGLPISVDPRVVLDSGIVSGNCVSACDKNTTYHHQNNPVIAELLRGHGSLWNFAGVVVTNEPTRLADKKRSAAAAVEQVIKTSADGVIVSKEGFGNPDSDLMMIVRGLEQAGVKSVAITDEFAGGDGGSQSLADTTPEADAVVSVGNANERLELPAMATTIGPLPDVTRLAGGYPHSLRDDGSMEVELQAIVGATNQLGFSRLSCREV